MEKLQGPERGVVCQAGGDARPGRVWSGVSVPQLRVRGEPGPRQTMGAGGERGGRGGSARAPPGQESRSLLINWVSKRQNKAWGWILTSQTRFLTKNNFPAFVSPLLLQSKGKSRLLRSPWLSRGNKDDF